MKEKTIVRRKIWDDNNLEIKNSKKYKTKQKKFKNSNVIELIHSNGYKNEEERKKFLCQN